MISLPANATTVPSRKADRTELGAFLRGRRVRVGTREMGAATALRPDPVPPRDTAARRGGLAGRGEFTVRAAAPGPEPDSEPGVPEFLHVLLRQVEPFPAAALSARWDILDFNRSYDALFSLESVPARNRNAMLLYFTDPAQRELGRTGRPTRREWSASSARRQPVMAPTRSGPRCWSGCARPPPTLTGCGSRTTPAIAALCRSCSCTRWPVGIAAGPLPAVGRAARRRPRRDRLHAR